jgi:hypothetical protein
MATIECQSGPHAFTKTRHFEHQSPGGTREQMRKLAYTILAGLSLVVAFCAGYFYRAADTPVTAEFEDYALTNVLENVGYAHYLAKGQFEDMRSMIDVSLDKHLSKARTHTGATSDPAAQEARTRILNAVGVIWDRYPPFQSPDFKASESNALWWHEWSASHKLNLAFVQEAMAKCSTTPALNCKGKAPESRLPAEHK